MQPSMPGEASAYRGGIGRSWPDRKWLTLAVVALGTLMTALDAAASAGRALVLARSGPGTATDVVALQQTGFRGTLLVCAGA